MASDILGPDGAHSSDNRDPWKKKVLVLWYLKHFQNVSRPGHDLFGRNFDQSDYWERSSRPFSQMEFHSFTQHPIFR